MTALNKSASIYIDGKQVDNTLKSLSAEAAKLRNAMANMIPGSAEFNAKAASLRTVRSQIDAINTSVTSVNKNWQMFKNNLAATATGVLGGNLMVAGVNAITTGLSSSVKKAAELSDLFADIEKTTGMTTDEVKELNKELGKVDTRTSKNDLLGIAKVAGQFGVAKEDVLGFVKAIDMVNVALGDEFQGGPEAVATEMTKLRNVFTDIKSQNIGADIKFISNVLNELGADGAATGPVVADIANRIGGVGIQAGLTSAQVLGISAAMQELNISTERGSTAVVKILQKMLTETETFARIAGKPIADFKKQLDTDLYGAFMSVLEGSRKVGTSSTLLAGVIKDLELQGAGASEVFAKFGSNSQLVSEKVALANKAISETSSITEEFRKKNENLAAEIEKLEKRWNKFWTSARATDFWSWMVEGANKAMNGIEAISDFLAASGNALTFNILQNARKAEKIIQEQQEKQLAIQEEYQVKVGRMKDDELAAERQALAGQLSWYKAMRSEMDGLTLAEKQKVLQEINTINSQLKMLNAESESRRKGTGGSTTPALGATPEEIQKRNQKIADDTKKLYDKLAELKISAIRNDEERELAQLQRKYLKQEQEVLNTSAKEKVKNDTLLALQAQYETDKEALISKFRDKIKSEEYKQTIESLVEVYSAKKLFITQQYADGLISEELYQQQLAELELNHLEWKKTAALDYGQQVVDIEQQIAEARINMHQSVVMSSEQVTNQSISNMRSSFSSLYGSLKAGENETLNLAKKNNEEKKKNLKKMLDSNLITQGEYNAQVAAMDEEYAKKESSLRSTQARREKDINTAEAIIDGLAASVEAFRRDPTGILAAVVGATTAIKIAAIRATPIPQYNTGGESYTVTGAQTGKQYNSRWVGSFARGGVYSSASLGLVGEEGTELVIPNWLYTAPAMVNTMGMLRGMIARGYNTGGTTTTTAATPGVGDPMVYQALAQVAQSQVQLSASLENLNFILSQGINSYITFEALEDAQKTNNRITSNSRIG